MTDQVYIANNSSLDNYAQHVSKYIDSKMEQSAHDKLSNIDSISNFGILSGAPTQNR